MPNNSNRQTSQSPDLTTFTIIVNGSELSEIYLVKNITIEKEVNRIPFAQIVIFDGEAATQDFKLSNEDLLIPGNTIEIKAGYHNDEETIFKGIIIKHSIKVRQAESAIVIECRDIAVKTTIGRKSAYFYDSTDSDIIEKNSWKI